MTPLLSVTTRREGRCWLAVARRGGQTAMTAALDRETARHKALAQLERLERVERAGWTEGVNVGLGVSNA